MDWLSAGAGVASAGSGLFSGIVNAIRGKKDRKTNETRYQEQMHREDTAHQRQADDMEAAGLSRTLSAGGAGAPSVSPGDMPQRDIEKFDAQAIASGMRAMLQQKKDIAKTDAEITRTKVLTDNEKITKSILDEKLKQEKDLNADLAHNRIIKDQSSLRTDADTRWTGLETILNTALTTLGTSKSEILGAISDLAPGTVINNIKDKVEDLQVSASDKIEILKEAEEKARETKKEEEYVPQVIRGGRY